MGKSKAPPPPDYGPIAAASAESARISAQVAQEQLAWAREQYYGDREVSDKVIQDALQRSAEQDALARKDRARYEQVFQPLEDQLVAESKTYNTEARREAAAGAAQADVAQQFDAARQNAMENLESYGVDPTQTRAGAMDASIRMQQAAAQASAGNQARQQVENTGRALRSEAVNIGKGLPGQAAASLNTAIQSGNQAVNAGIATTSTGANSMGTGVQWQGQNNAALGTWGNVLNQGYQNQLAAYKQNQSQSSGIGSLLGMGLGIAGKMMFGSDERLKENITPVGKTEDGQTIYRFNYKGEEATQMGLLAQEVEQHHPEAVAEDAQGVKFVDYKQALPVKGEKDSYADGGHVSMERSPSRGRAIDDVDAKLTAGEYIIPEDVVRAKGSDFFDKMIQKARKAVDVPAPTPRYAMGS